MVPKPVSMFNNLFKNTAKPSSGHIHTDINKDLKSINDRGHNDDNANGDSDDDDEHQAIHPSKRKYTQFGYFSRRPTCTADSDFLTVVVSGIEVSDLFYVDRLWSPKPYLELTVGAHCLHTADISYLLFSTQTLSLLRILNNY